MNDNYQLHLDNIKICYGSTVAVENLSLDIERGEIACLLGPSGCGKTSLQRAIAGFEPVVSGEIWLAGQNVSRPSFSLPPEQRHVGMVFQDFALFPHLDVEKNIGFGLRGMDGKTRRKRIDEVLALVDLERFAARFPHELSGGQQQRVALARAIAPKPDILLLDEPFSSLDTTLRESIARDVRKLLKDQGTTAVFVTHDQHEAFALADKIAVIDQGHLLQWATPYELYHKPASRFVAGFIGEGVMIHVEANAEGKLSNELGDLANGGPWQHGKTYDVLMRPDDVVYDEKSPVKLPIVDKLFRGAEYLYRLQLADKQHVLCVAPSHKSFEIGDRLAVRVDLQHQVVFDE